MKMNNFQNDFGLEKSDLNNIYNGIKSVSPNAIIKIFGSRAIGKNRPGSDLDIAIIDHLLSLDKILDIRFELNNLNLPYDFDIINYFKIKNKDLKEHIDRVGIEVKI